MRAWLILICLLLAACENGVSSGTAGGGRKQIDCAKSYLVLGVAGQYQCEQFAPGNVTDGERPYSGMYQSFNIFGRTDDGVALSLQAGKALGGVYYNPNVNPNFNAQKSIQTFPNTTVTQGKDWSSLRSVDGATVMNFTSAAQSCFGLIKFGGLVRGGYDYELRGYFCRKSGSFTDEQIAALLNQVIVRSSLSQPLPAAMLPKPLFNCELGSSSSFETANEAGCLKMGGRIQPL